MAKIQIPTWRFRRENGTLLKKHVTSQVELDELGENWVSDIPDVDSPALVDVKAPSEEEESEEKLTFVDPNIDPATGLRLDGPTLSAWVGAGQKEKNYPPKGYAKRPEAAT